MCLCTRIVLFLNLLFATDLIGAAPAATRDAPSHPEAGGKTEAETSLEKFLSDYYDTYVGPRREEHTANPPEDDIYESMQGDQPLAENNINQNLRPYAANATDADGALGQRNFTDIEYIRTMRNRSKENWLQVIKDNILRQIRRGNATVPKPDDARLSSINMSEILPSFLNSTNLLNDDQITEKIRSFYPSCEIPVNTDQDVWKDDDIMNLFFNFDYSDDRNTNIATATLRLYRLPENGTKFVARPGGDCDNFNSTDDEKLLRVSIYWYTKSLKKRRVKRRLSDSKVIPEHSRWVELSVKPAAKAWTRGRNLGLGVLVEDQEGNLLRADRYFKGASCMVGSSTPKPIPTIIADIARKTNELNRIHSLLGRNTTAAVYSDVQLLPTIDICTLEFPENYTQPAHIMNLRINACNLRKIHEQSQKKAEKERLERLATLPDFLMPSPRHIRHQRQHLANKMNENNGAATGFDPRWRIVGSTVIIRNEELQNLPHHKLNVSTINR